MASPLRKTIIALVAIAGIGAAGYEISRPEQLPVDLEALERGALEVTINADATTRIRDIYELSAPVTGRVLRSPVEVGQDVVAGETVLARFEPGEPAFLDARSLTQARAAVKQAEAALALAAAQITIAEADLDNAQRQLSRLHDLYERGTNPKAQLEEAEIAVDIASAKLNSAHAAYDMRASELEAQQAQLIGPDAGDDPSDLANACCIEITAPVSGEVLNVVNDSARMVQAGAPILSVGQLEDMEIVVDLLSTDAVRIAPGARAHVERWGGEEVLEARVRVIEPAAFTKVSALGIEEQRVKVVLDFTAPASTRPALGHGFRVYLRIVEWQGDDVLRLPISALYRKGQDWAVFVAGEDADGKLRAHERMVEIGRRNADYAQVLNGLEAGERVIVHPADRVGEGVLLVERVTQ